MACRWSPASSRPHDAAWFKDLKAQLDEYKFDRVYAWGHPDGLERGKNWKAYDEMVSMIPYAKAIGAEVMRVVGSSLMFRHEPHGPQIEALVKMFKQAVPVAKDNGVKLAVENHIDFTSDEILQLLKKSIRTTLGSTSTPATSCACWTTRSPGWKNWPPTSWRPTSRI